MTKADFINWLAAFFKDKHDFYVTHEPDKFVTVDSDDLWIDMRDDEPFVCASISITTVLLLEAVFDMWKKVRDN